MSDYSIDSLMDLNALDVSIFSDSSTELNYNKYIYKTNPKYVNKDISPDEHYRSKVRILLNPHDPVRHILGHTIVHQTQYYCVDQNGGFLVPSKLSESIYIGEAAAKQCPLFKAFCKLYYSKEPEKKEFAQKMFDKRESDWVLIQVIEDLNRPELVGQLMLMKLSQKSIKPVLLSKIIPSPDGKTPAEPLLDYLIGPVLNIDVTPGPDDPMAPERKQREISYSLCNFDSNNYEPITKIDGTPLFTDEELELIENYSKTRKDSYFAKSATKRASAKEEFNKLLDQIKPLYIKAFEYLKENAPNLHDEIGYKEWSADLTNRVMNWINSVLNMQDPSLINISVAANTINNTSNSNNIKAESEQIDMLLQEPILENDDLPF